MVRFLKNSMLALGVAGLMILPSYAQTSNANDQAMVMTQSDTATSNQNMVRQYAQVSNSQRAEQNKVRAEGEGWQLRSSTTQINGGGGAGGVGGR
jgi:hypothetical protein